MILRSSLTITLDFVIMFAICWQLASITVLGMAVITAWNFVFKEKQREVTKLI